MTTYRPLLMMFLVVIVAASFVFFVLGDPSWADAGWALFLVVLWSPVKGVTYRRLGDEEAAAAVLEPIAADMEIIENDSYHRRLLMYKGEVGPEELLDLRAEDDPDTALQIATQGYGVGNWYLVNGDEEAARGVFERILEGTSWAAFGYIAAEADLNRWDGR